MSESPEYNIWRLMNNRCHHPEADKYEYYGGRGISVCEAWRTDFPAFYAHIGPRPSMSHSVDRRDNNLGYAPGNVYWATRTEQMRNTRSNRNITIGGATKTVGVWLDEMGIAYSTFHRRTTIQKMTDVEAITIPMTPRADRGKILRGSL